MQLVVSDVHEGLSADIGSVMISSGWRWCREHFFGNVPDRTTKGHGEMVAAAIRTISAQPDADDITEQFEPREWGHG